MRVLVIGLAQTAEAVTRQLVRRGHEVVVLDDRPTDASRAVARELGVKLVTDVDVATLVAGADLVSPSPGVAIGHAAIQAAIETGVPVWSEFEFAAEWDDRPIVAITGTNGKTTTTALVTSMLQASGRVAVAGGNENTPLVDLIDDPATEVFVVETSTFRLQFTERFHAFVAVWLNLTPDHLDWHPTVEHYADAKFRVWATQREGDLAVANADDPVVMRYAERAPARVQTYGLERGDWRIADGRLLGPDGLDLVAVSDLPRNLPHDLSNALGAAATAIGAGAEAEACAAALRDFRGLPHRVQLVSDAGGVRWYDDSKATSPASVIAAVRGFPSVVLIAGGKNKGLDMTELRGLGPHLRAVVAIGEAASLIADTFDGVAPVVTAGSMDDAVGRAADLAQPGDAVLLSPACASYDWYRNFAERGDDFARAVRDLERAG